MNNLLITLRRNLALIFDQVGTRLRNNFYIYLAVILTVVALVDVVTVNRVAGMRNQSFDAMVKNRFVVRPPDKNIVIVDIDEKSLAAMAPEFGRWPWPRQVLGEFVENIETHKPQAIVFDILMSDPDIYNSESDAYFNQVIDSTTNTWFPMIRLGANADSVSMLPASALPGTRTTSAPDSPKMVGAILPFFAAIQESGRLGFNNIFPDIDGVSREYPVRYFEGGYQVPSLPYAVAQSIHPREAVPNRILLNWRGKPFTYPHISFSDVYTDMRKENPTRVSNEFAGKIVIIGSTAPSLFDIKVTAIDRQFPGVEILATALDNLLAGDWLRVPEMPLVYLLITLIILWATALGFYRKGTGGKLDTFYGLSQFILIVIAYSAINFLNIYINLTGPVMFGFIYYSVARYYSFATARALDPSVVRAPVNTSQTIGYLVALRFDLPTREEKLLAKLAQVICHECQCTPSAEWLSGRQRGFWRLFENTLFICWRTSTSTPDALKNIRHDADALIARLERILDGKPMGGALPSNKVSISRAEGSIDEKGPHEWRQLMGKALLDRTPS